MAPGPAAAFPQRGLDLPNIAFGAQTTLAYTENAAGTGGTLTVGDAARRQHRASDQLHGRELRQHGCGTAAPWSLRRRNSSRC